MPSPLHPLTTDITPPERFTYPFCYEPHPLCILAAEEVKREIERISPSEGKMFGVLVVEGGFLAAYSGLLEGRNDWDYFVPPVYDAQQPDGYFKTKEREISLIASRSPLTSKKMSQELQLWLFHQYQLLNARGETKDLVDIWQEYYTRPKLRQRFPLPPGGTGDCCAPKLLQYAYQQGLKPVCMAEFWWGQSTKEELRQHLNFYPACRGKCKPILTWMLQGLDVDPDPETLGFKHLELKTVYEDNDIVVVDKPSGMLSTRGRIEQYSVESVMQQRYPGAFVAHRLDMGTSGLLIVAKTLDAYHDLQQQFIKHEVKKKYIAVLETPLPSKKGTISLPLRPDPMNRPRQIVDMEHGKRAVTEYEFMEGLCGETAQGKQSEGAAQGKQSEANAQGRAVVALYPQTGRTHQLRIHCAHPDGLGCPIVGDELYGTKGERLMLHAAEIWFRHPITKEAMHLVSPPPFLP